MTPTISVIIPAYNRLHEVAACLTSLQRFASKQIDIRFLVQDDASPDCDLRLLLPPCAASVERNAVNLGFGGNCNQAAARADGDILFMVNQDVFAGLHPLDGDPISQDWDIHLVNAFADDKVGVVGAKLLFPDGRIQNAGGKYDGHCAPYHIGLGYANHRYWEVNTPCEVSWTTGAAMAIRRDLFNQLGGFDVSYGRGYFEDVEICVKARLAGAKVWYEPRVTLLHAVGTSGGSPTFAKNAMLFKERWVDTKIVKPDVMAIKERFW